MQKVNIKVTDYARISSFLAKIVETKSVCQSSMSKFDGFLKRGKGVSSLCVDFLFFEETLFSSLNTTKYSYFHNSVHKYI